MLTCFLGGGVGLSPHSHGTWPLWPLFSYMHACMLSFLSCMLPHLSTPMPLELVPMVIELHPLPIYRIEWCLMLASLAIDACCFPFLAYMFLITPLSNR